MADDSMVVVGGTAAATDGTHYKVNAWSLVDDDDEKVFFSSFCSFLFYLFCNLFAISIQSQHILKHLMLLLPRCCESLDM